MALGAPGGRIAGAWGREWAIQGRSAVCRSGREGDLQAAHAHVVVRQCVPQQYSSGLEQPAHVEADQPGSSQLRVGAFDRRAALDVQRTAEVAAHEGAPLCLGGGVGGLGIERVDLGVAAARCRHDGLGATLGQLVDGVQLRVAAVGQPVIGREVVALLDVLVHRSHLPHVAAAVGDRHGGDQLRLGVHRQLGVEGRPEAAVGHLHDARIGVGRAHPRLGLGHAGLGAAGVVVAAVAASLGGLGRLGLGRRLVLELVHRGQRRRHALLALASGPLGSGLLAPCAGTGVLGEFALERLHLSLRLGMQLGELVAPAEAAGLGMRAHAQPVLRHHVERD